MLSDAIEQFRTFVAGLNPAQCLVAMHDWDADGVTSGVIWQRTFERLGFSNLQLLVPDRRRDACRAGLLSECELNVGTGFGRSSPG